MHDATDDGFHEIQLSGKQLVFLFMATTVVSVVIFLCGVLVGRGVRAESAGDPGDPDPTVAMAPAATDTVADAGPPALEPPAPAEEGSADPVPAPPPPADAPERPADTRAPRTSEPPPAAPDTRTAARTSDRPPVRTPQQAAEPREPAASASAPQKGTWVVQLVALRDRSAAGSIVRRLSGKGYPAFLVTPSAGAAVPVFKVQVGRYADKSEAEQVARRLEREEQFKPWVSR